MKHILKPLLGLLIFCTVYVLAICLLVHGENKREKIECYKWQQEAKDYPNYYLLKWQADQCENHKIEVDALVK